MNQGNKAYSSRRNFIKLSALSTAFLMLRNKVLGRNTESEQLNYQSLRPFSEMRPGEIRQAIEAGPYAFVPVSPMIEWHSFHLPMGTDGLISESICRLMAGNMGGIWFRPLSLGLDSWRNDEEKEMWGFKSEEEVFGMNFPDVSIKSEYCQVDEMIKVIENRVKILKGIGLKHVFLLNHHGGKGQFKTIEDLAKVLSDEKTKVHGLRTYQFNDLKPEDGFHGVGGHAGYSETTWLLAYRPELVDMTTQKSGKLSVRITGILHSKPEIEAEWNPRNVSITVANKLRGRVTDNFVNYIKKL